jgi:hypothetical protein
VLSDILEAARALLGREPRAGDRRRSGWLAAAGDDLAAGASY